MEDGLEEFKQFVNDRSKTDYCSHTTKKVKPFDENKTWGSTCTMIVWKENQNKDL